MTSLLTTLRNGLAGAMQSISYGSNTPPLGPALDIGSTGTPSLRGQPWALHALMRGMAMNSAVYESIAAGLPRYGLEGVALQGLRNPTNAVAQFYRATLWPGTIREDDAESALPLIMPERTTNDALRAAIHGVWRASNWNSLKDDVAYDNANLGEQVLKIVEGKPTKPPYVQVIQPEFLTDLDVDGRRYLTYIRLDIPISSIDAESLGYRTADQYRTIWRTEIWDKRRSTYRVWVHQEGATTPDNELGTPLIDTELDQVYGVDFIPFVHMMHERSSASPRGIPATLRAFDKIVYLDVLATSLHQRLNNHNTDEKVLQSQLTGAMGEPLPPPMLGDAGKVTVNGTTIWSLPSGWTMNNTASLIDFVSHAAEVVTTYESLKNTDLPELAWGLISESGNDVSGKALQYQLTAAKARCDQARGMAEDALIRATQMALSVGQAMEVAGFDAASIGTYDTGALDFWIDDRPIVPLTEQERDDLDTAKANRLKVLTDAGASLEAAAKTAGYTDDEIMMLADVGIPPAR